MRLVDDALPENEMEYASGMVYQDLSTVPNDEADVL